MNKLIVVGDSFCANYVNQMNQLFIEGKNKTWDVIESFPIWPEIVANKLNLNLINKSYSSIGNMAIYALVLDAIVTEKKFKLIVVWSSSNRINFEDPDLNTTLGTWSKRYDGHFRDGKYNIELKNMTPPRGNIRSYLRYVYSIQEICKSKNIDVKMFQSVHPINRKDYNNNDYYSKDEYKNMEKDLLNSPYYNLIDRNIFPDFPGDMTFDYTSSSMTDILKKNDIKKTQINKKDHHPNQYGSEVIANHILKSYK